MTLKLHIKSVQFTDDELLQLCKDNEELRIERNEKQQIVIMAPTGFNTGRQNIKIGAKLDNWNEDSKLGVVADSSTGYKLPDGSVRSPDASWVSLQTWKTIAEDDKDKFLPTCPEFVVEILSKSDSLEELKKKMQSTWIANGTKLAWLIDSKSKRTFIYRANGSIEIMEGFDKKLSGEDILEGFEFDLSWLKDI
ncbi:MAG: Uma2 family endonuclease [Arenicella sp.]|jgi:Uma2 family endonuclease